MQSGDIWSRKPETWDALATFAETTYVFLVLLGKQRRLTEDELFIFDRAAKAAAVLRV